MDASLLAFDASQIPVIKLAEEIKRYRAYMLRNCSPRAYITYHRKIDVEHDGTETCWCNPVVIGQNDHRPSLYFAREILYPVMH